MRKLIRETNSLFIGLHNYTKFALNNQLAKSPYLRATLSLFKRTGWCSKIFIKVKDSFTLLIKSIRTYNRIILLFNIIGILNLLLTIGIITTFYHIIELEGVFP